MAASAVEKRGRRPLTTRTIEAVNRTYEGLSAGPRCALVWAVEKAHLEALMRNSIVTLSLVGLGVVGACGGADARPDDALKNDLALAAQVQPYQAQQFVSPGEQQLGPNGLPLAYNAINPNTPVYRAPAPVYRAPARRTASRARSSSGGTYYPAPREPIRHTKRDAAIGAAAGAIIGATTSRDRVKGGLIGAAAGGILGGIIGHTVDVQRP